MAVLFLQIFWLEKWNFLIFTNSLGVSYFNCSEVKLGKSHFFNFQFETNFSYFLIQILEIEVFPTLKVHSTSCSIRQYHCFFKTNVFWNIWRLQCKSELGSDEIHFHIKPNVALLTNKTWRLKKLHDTFIFSVGYSRLVKLVRSFTFRKTVCLSLEKRFR